MSKIPQTDSIQELADFWDTHDLADFEEELEEVSEPVFQKDAESVIPLRLKPDQISILHRLAEARGIDDAALIREWVNEKLQAS